MKQKLWAVIPAAGVGARMAADRPKQYLMLRDQSQQKTIIEHTLKRLLTLPDIEKLLVAISTQDPYWPKLDIAQHAKVQTVPGGKERCDSVLSGLNALCGLAADDDWVLVHDAARPCVKITDIENLLSVLQTHADGGLLGMPASDTLKRVSCNRIVAETVDRNEFWHAQTPQIFPFKKLHSALSQALAKGQGVTDEASAIELAGMKPVMVTASRNNIKITQAEDLALAEFILQQQAKELL